MITTSALLLTAAALVAAADWFSVARNRPSIEAVAKPSVMVALALAVVLGGTAETRWFVVAGLLLSLAGDVALLERVDRFVVGLASFLVAHIFYVAAFVTESSNAPRNSTMLAVGVLLLVVLGSRGLSIISSAAEESPKLRLPVTLYIVVLSIMVLAASMHTAVGATGAWLFATSDAILGWNRFVRPLDNGRLVTHVLYHLGQGLIAVWAIGL